jgi:hypothetical protein
MMLQLSLRVNVGGSHLRAAVPTYRGPFLVAHIPLPDRHDTLAFLRIALTSST